MISHSVRKILFEISISLTLIWVTKCMASSTITEANPFNANEDADKLLAAVTGLGTDEQAFSLLTKRICKQREEIRKARDDLWLKAIEEDFIADEATRTLIIGSLYCGPSFYRYQFKLCFDAGDATGVAEMLSILSNQPDTLEIVKREYFEAEQILIEDALSQTFSKDFVHWCSTVIMIKRDIKGVVDAGAAEKEAAALIASIPNWKTDRAKLNDCLLKPSFLQVREILAKFKEQNKQMDLATTIYQAQFDDQNLTMAYKNLIHDLSDELDYITTRLKEVTDAGDKLGLNRLILSRSEIDLKEAMQAFQDMYKVTLQTKIQETLAGLPLLQGPQVDLLLGFLGVNCQNASR